MPCCSLLKGKMRLRILNFYVEDLCCHLKYSIYVFKRRVTRGFILRHSAFLTAIHTAYKGDKLILSCQTISLIKQPMKISVTLFHFPISRTVIPKAHKGGKFNILIKSSPVLQINQWKYICCSFPLSNVTFYPRPSRESPTVTVPPKSPKPSPKQVYFS